MKWTVAAFQVPTEPFYVAIITPVIHYCYLPVILFSCKVQIPKP